MLSVYVVTFDPTEPTTTKLDDPEGARSIWKPVSFVELSVHLNVTEERPALPVSPLGAAIRLGFALTVIPTELVPVAPWLSVTVRTAV